MTRTRPSSAQRRKAAMKRAGVSEPNPLDDLTAWYNESVLRRRLHEHIRRKELAEGRCIDHPRGWMRWLPEGTMRPCPWCGSTDPEHP